MADVEKAMRLFHEAGLAFPTIPRKCLPRIKERHEWWFSTRAKSWYPYDPRPYSGEFDRGRVRDYVLLCHSGHGVNSYAIQYYLVYGQLGIFVHLAWGGVYMDAAETAGAIRQCFSLTDQVVAAAQTSVRLGPSTRLKIIACDFYGSGWGWSSDNEPMRVQSVDRPCDALSQALQWLTTSPDVERKTKPKPKRKNDARGRLEREPR